MIYFAQAGGDDGPVKIGFSLTPRLRVMQIQSSCPLPVRLLGVAPGNRATERELHLRFAAHRIRGEWFACAEDVRAAMDGLSPVEALQPARSKAERRERRRRGVVDAMSRESALLTTLKYSGPLREPVELPPVQVRLRWRRCPACGLPCRSDIGNGDGVRAHGSSGCRAAGAVWRTLPDCEPPPGAP